jgi:hypothetical protein
MRRRFAFALALAVVSLSRAAAAAPDERRSLDALYAQGRAAFDAGDYGQACPLFAEYYERDPVPAAVFTLAECEARWGKQVQALSHFEAFVRKTADAPSTPVLEHRLRIANEQISRLSLQVGKVLPRLAAEVQGSVLVKLDGVPVPIPPPHPFVVEPGEHTIELVTEAGTHEQKRFIVGAGELRQIEVGAAPPRVLAPTPPVAQGGHRLTPVVLVAGGIGVAGVVAGAVLGGIAWSHAADVDAHCEGDLCDPAGKRAADRAQGLATASNVAFTAGLVGIAAAVVLFLVEPRSRGAALGRSLVGASD